MASVTIDPTVPASPENQGGGLGASRIRNIASWLLEMFGQPGTAPFTFNSNPFNVDASGNVTIPQALTVGGTATLAADPTLPLQAATKQYVDKATPPIAVYQYTSLPTNVVVPQNVKTQILQTAVLPALAVSPHGVWIVSFVARCLFIAGGSANATVGASLQTSSQFGSNFVSTLQTGGNSTEPANLSFILAPSYLVADGHTIQATLSVQSVSFTPSGFVVALDSIFNQVATDIVIVAVPQ